MKTISDFLKGKICRSEANHLLQVDQKGQNDAEFGRFEASLVSPTGRSHFYKGGLVLNDGQRLPYSDIVRVMISEKIENGRLVHIIDVHGEKYRLRCSEAGGLVLHATLRWIGNTQLKRKIAN